MPQTRIDTPRRAATEQVNPGGTFPVGRAGPRTAESSRGAREAAMADEEPLGRDYVLHEQLGQGAIGVVRRATRVDGGPPLAAKLLRVDLAGDRRVRNLFLHE